MTEQQKTVLILAGVDPTGQAGIYADMVVLNQFTVNQVAISTMQTAQVEEFKIWHADPEMMAVQTQCIDADVVKVGAVGNEQIADVIVDYLRTKNLPVVFDPVIKTSSGDVLSSINAIKKILSYVTILTPNTIEAELLTQTAINSHGAVEQAAKEILAFGCQLVLITGAHLSGETVSDYFTDGLTSFWLNTPRSDDKRRTGCRLSSAIVGALAEGEQLSDAIVRARMVLQEYLEAEELPWLTQQPQSLPENVFPSCGPEPLGLYPIVDSAHQVLLCCKKFTTIQLRIKNKHNVEQEIASSIAYARQNNVRLFINDHWQMAIKYQAYGVHLGQGDLKVADIDAIKRAGLRLRVSTHCYTEIARAHALHPSYIAYGPIFPTNSKPMRFGARGVASLQAWCAQLGYPIVAIGGITPTEYPAILSAGANGVAFISALTQFSTPDSERYQRQITLQNIGELGQKKLHDAKVLIVGVGGLGAPVAMYLAACGVGHLGLVDGDQVAFNNLPRQIIFDDVDVGRPKVSCAVNRLRALNPYCQVRKFNEMLSEKNALDIVSQYDIIIDCSDNFATKYLINDVCVRSEKPFVMASVDGDLGQVITFSGQNGPCYRCLFESIDDGVVQNCNDAGILGVVPGIVGTLQANEVIKFILEQNDNVNQLFMIDAKHLTIKKIAVSQNKNCPACSQKIPFEQLDRPAQKCALSSGISYDELQKILRSQKIQLIDVRTYEEFKQKHLPGAINIPLKDLQRNFEQLSKNQPIVVYCQHGPRSQSACSLLLDNNFFNVNYLLGGIVALYMNSLLMCYAYES